MFHSIEIGKKISQYRTKLNIPQILLAKLLGVSTQAVSKWECGDSIPDLNNLSILSEIFNVPLDELIGLKNRSAKNISSKDYTLYTGGSYNQQTKNKKVERTIYLELRQDNTIMSDVEFKHSVYSKCKLNNIKITNVKCIDLIYVDNSYHNITYTHCTFERCQLKANILNAIAIDCTFIYNININEILKDVEIKNSRLSFSSYTNVTFINTIIHDSSWHRCIFYKAYLEKCSFLNLHVTDCNFQKCTLIDCTFDKSTYKCFNVKGNKIIRPIII